MIKVSSVSDNASLYRLLVVYGGRNEHFSCCKSAVLIFLHFGQSSHVVSASYVQPSQLALVSGISSLDHEDGKNMTRHQTYWEEQRV
jgi:hypothetical protein